MSNAIAIIQAEFTVACAACGCPLGEDWNAVVIGEDQQTRMCAGCAYEASTGRPVCPIGPQ